jgi:hypothetical protein
MLRGSFCQTESSTFTALMVVGIFLIAALKALTVITAFRATQKQKTILPTTHDTGSSTGIQRSPSEITLSKRYMSAREPHTPSMRSPPPTPTAAPLLFSQEDIKLRMPQLEEP